MATSPTRQPGSSIKPFTYIAAFEKGWTPSTLIWDVPTQFPDGANPPYEPRNYDGKFHGGLSVRLALANSFNIPAVKTLEFVGIYDDPNTEQKDGLIGTAERLGITSLTRNDYGLSLTLGGGDVSLIDMTSAYSVIANGGQQGSARCHPQDHRLCGQRHLRISAAGRGTGYPRRTCLSHLLHPFRQRSA